MLPFDTPEEIAENSILRAEDVTRSLEEEVRVSIYEATSSGATEEECAALYANWVAKNRKRT